VGSAVRTAMASSSRKLARKSMTDLLGGAESSLSLRMSGGRAVRVCHNRFGFLEAYGSPAAASEKRC
jgi:hypothetical protein